MNPSLTTVAIEIGRVFSITLPMRIHTSKKKIEAINLNIYRNLYHYSVAFQKKAFHDAIKPLLQNIPHLDEIHLRYDVCPKTRRRLDIMNVGSIVDKYFSDVLVEAKIIDDDDYNHVSGVSFGFGGIVTDEHVRVTITEIKSRKVINMRVLLDDEDIQTALNTHVQTLGIEGATGVDVTVNGDGNITAEVMIGETKPTKTPVKRKPKVKPTAKKEEPTDDSLETAGTSSTSGDDSGTGESTASSAEETEPKDEPTTKAEGKESKNPSEDSPEESSNSGETEEETPPVNKVKKGSIFDT